jgi:hypothetical protein
MKQVIWKTLCISLVLVLLWPQVTIAALTKTENTQAMEWTLLTNTEDANGIKETGSIDVSDAYQATLHIDCCIATTTAHEGTEIIVEIASEAAVDDAWTYLWSTIGPSGTATKADCNAVNSGTTIYCTNPATANLDEGGKHIFIYDAGTVANSQIAYQVVPGTDAADTIVVLDTPLATDTDCDVLTITGARTSGQKLSAVGTYAIIIPGSASQARVIFNNYDDDGTGASVCVRVRVTKTTAL